MRISIVIPLLCAALNLGCERIQQWQLEARLDAALANSAAEITNAKIPKLTHALQGSGLETRIASGDGAMRVFVSPTDIRIDGASGIAHGLKDTHRDHRAYMKYLPIDALMESIRPLFEKPRSVTALKAGMVETAMNSESGLRIESLENALAEVQKRGKLVRRKFENFRFHRTVSLYIDPKTAWDTVGRILYTASYAEFNRFTFPINTPKGSDEIDLADLAFRFVGEEANRPPRLDLFISKAGLWVSTAKRLQPLRMPSEKPIEKLNEHPWNDHMLSSPQHGCPAIPRKKGKLQLASLPDIIQQFSPLTIAAESGEKLGEFQALPVQVVYLGAATNTPWQDIAEVMALLKSEVVGMEFQLRRARPDQDNSPDCHDSLGPQQVLELWRKGQKVPK